MLLGSVGTGVQLTAAPPNRPGASSPIYPLKVSANRRYLVDQNNTLCFVKIPPAEIWQAHVDSRPRVVFCREPCE